MTVPSVPVDADTTKPTLLDVVRVLLTTYSDHGALIWLNSGNRAWPMTGSLRLRMVASHEVPYWSPRQMIDVGLIAEVLEVAERLENGGG